jgi:hypothetical protein
MYAEMTVRRVLEATRRSAATVTSDKSVTNFLAVLTVMSTRSTRSLLCFWIRKHVPRPRRTWKCASTEYPTVFA